MKTTKGFILGLIVGFSVLFTSVYASVSGAGTLGNLFGKVGSNYKLLGDNIKDNTVDSSEIENNTLTSDDIKNGEIKNADIANNAVNSIKVENNTLTEDDLAPNSVGNSELANNAVKGENIDPHFGLWNKNGNNLYYNNGYVGIGTTTPRAKLDINGSIKTNSELYVHGRERHDKNTGIYWSNNHWHIYPESNYVMKLRSGHDNNVGLRLSDKQDTKYGYLRGDGNGANFGILDGDGNWSYLAAKDNYTQFRINNTRQMEVNKYGKLSVRGDIYSRGKKVLTESNKTIFWTRTIDGNDIDSYHSDGKTDSLSCRTHYKLLNYGVKYFDAKVNSNGWEGGKINAYELGNKVYCNVQGNGSANDNEGKVAGQCFITCYK